MKTVSIPPATSGKARLGGVALASVIIALMLSLLLEALDQTIVGSAMPRIIAELHGLDRYTWVVTAYVLATMTMVPIVGKLLYQFGRKWFLLGGTALFLVGIGSARSSPSPSSRKTSCPPVVWASARWRPANWDSWGQRWASPSWERSSAAALPGTCCITSPPRRQKGWRWLERSSTVL